MPDELTGELPDELPNELSEVLPGDIQDESLYARVGATIFLFVSSIPSMPG